MKTCLEILLLCLGLTGAVARVCAQGYPLPLPVDPDAALGSDAHWVRFAKQFAPTPQDNSYFGFAIATDGNWLAVGAPFYDNTNPEGITGLSFEQVGKVYLYERSGTGWTLRYSITGNQEYALLGYSVALLGDDLVVGSPAHDLDGLPAIGLASFFRRQGSAWIANGTFACCYAAAETGRSVALSSNRFDTFAYVGSPGARSSELGPDTGLAFAFHKNDAGTWDLESLPTPADLSANDSYATAVAGSGGLVVVGAPLQDTDGFTNAGAAYVFGRSKDGDWSQQQKLSFFDTTALDVFGGSVAVDRDWIAVGAIGRSVDGHVSADTGAVQLFRYTEQYGWSTWQELAGSNAASGDGFGGAVALDGSQLLVGARYDDTATIEDAGAVYLFERDTSGVPPQPDWQQSGKFFHANAAIDDAFGAAVTLTGQVAVVGARSDNTDAAPNLAEAGSFTSFFTDGIFADGYEP